MENGREQEKWRTVTKKEKREKEKEKEKEKRERRGEGVRSVSGESLLLPNSQSSTPSLLLSPISSPLSLSHLPPVSLLPPEHQTQSRSLLLIVAHGSVLVGVGDPSPLESLVSHIPVVSLLLWNDPSGMTKCLFDVP
jgi:hypothetical protein